MLTPAQARDLIDHFGGQRAAARAVGVHHSTVRYWTDPDFAERHRAWRRENYHNLPSHEYYRRQLVLRRYKALRRQEKRLVREEV